MSPRASDVPLVSVTHRPFRPAVTFPADSLLAAFAEMDQVFEGGHVADHLARRYAEKTGGQVEVSIPGQPIACAGSLVTA